MKKEDRMMTIDELSEYLRMSKSKIFALVKSNTIPSHRIGRKTLRFLESEIQEFISRTDKQTGFIGQPMYKQLEDEKWIQQLNRDKYYNQACIVLQETGLLDNVPIDDVRIIMDSLDYRHLSFHRDECLLQVKEKPDHFLILNEGSLRISMDNDHIIKPNTFWKESIVGLDCLFSKKKTSYYSVYGESDGNAILYHFDHLVHFHRISRVGYEAIVENMFAYEIDRSIYARKKLDFMQKPTLAQRILEYLLQKEDAYGGSPFVVASPAEIASHIGCSLVSLTKYLNSLQTKGIISQNEQNIWIYHPHAEEYMKGKLI